MKRFMLLLLAVLMVVLMVSPYAQATAPLTEQRAEALVKAAYAHVWARKIPGTAPLVRQAGANEFTVFFEVFPVGMKKSSKEVQYYHLATFRVGTNGVLEAYELERVVDSNTTGIVTNLASGSVETVTFDTPLKPLETPAPPAKESVDQKKQGDANATGCTICASTVKVDGHYDEDCMVGCMACGLGYIFTCLTCPWRCWVPGYSYCERWEYSDLCTTPT